MKFSLSILGADLTGWRQRLLMSVAWCICMSHPGWAEGEPVVDSLTTQPEPQSQLEPELKLDPLPSESPSPPAGTGNEALALLGRAAGGSPYGSLLYATSEAEFGWNMGTAGSGFHYQEKGGYLAGALLSVLIGMGAQDQANRTHQTVQYYTPDADAFGKLGMVVDAVFSQGFLAALYWNVIFDNDGWGLNRTKVFSVSRETPVILGIGAGYPGFFGFIYLYGIVPMGKWFQAEATLSGAPSLGFTANAGNYGFLRTRVLVSGDLIFTVGARL